MTAAHRRHDMTEDVWERLKSHLPGGEADRGMYFILRLTQLIVRPDSR